MPEITLVRHGQAKQNATSEEDYDHLSELGRMQAKWVGEHFRKLKLSYDVIVTGTLTRQIDTQILMDVDTKTPVVRDERFNEIRLYDLAGLLKNQFGIDFPKDEEGNTIRTKEQAIEYLITKVKRHRRNSQTDQE